MGDRLPYLPLYRYWPDVITCGIKTALQLSMKYKALCRDYDIDISRRFFFSCQYLRRLVYDKFQIVVQLFMQVCVRNTDF